MRLKMFGAATAALGLVFAQAATAAQPIRASSALPAAKPNLASVSSIGRALPRGEKKNNLLGLPLFVAFLGAVAVTVVTVVVVNEIDDDNDSPG